jgi:hypothetical protein
VFLIKLITLKIDRTASTGAMGIICNMLVYLGLRWWQNIIVGSFHEDCIIAEVIGSRKTIFVSRIQLCPSDPAIPFKLCTRRFPIKTAFAMTIIKAQKQTLKCVGIRVYPASPVFPPCPAVCDIFPSLFIWQRRCCKH